MTEIQQITRNDAIFEKLERSLPGLRFQVIVLTVILMTILPVETIAVFLTYKMTFEGQDMFLIGGLALQAIASIGTLHVIKKIGNPVVNAWIGRIAGLAFFCFVIGFGFIAATTSLKEVLINLMPDMGASSISLEGSQLETSNTINADAFNWLIPYAWYCAFTGLTLVLAFAAAEVLDRIMKLHAQVGDILSKCKHWTDARSQYEQAQNEIDRLDAAKSRWDRDLQNAIDHHIEQLKDAFDNGLSDGPRKLLQTLSEQSGNTRQSILIPLDDGRTAEIDVPQLQQKLEIAEASCDLTEIQNVPQLSFDFEKEGTEK